MNPRAALNVDMVGSKQELVRLCEMLEEVDVRATFFVTGSFREEDQIEILLDKKHEIASHTLTHPSDLTGMPHAEKEGEIVDGHDGVMKLCTGLASDFHIKGFRSPFYKFDEDILRVLRKLGYVWDSSQAFFPAFYKPFKVTTYGSIMEIPSLFPDDTVILGMLNLGLGEAERVWKDAYKASNGCFVWGIHPSVMAKNDERIAMLEHFIRFLRGQGADILTMSELANSIRLSPTG